jgi:hypothetical protein
MTAVSYTTFQSKQKQHLRETISLLAAGLKSGQQTRDVLCPQCNGGNSQEKSFSIRRESLIKIWYKCWRASCRLRGVIDSVGGFVADSPWEQEADKRPDVEIQGRRYEGMLGPLTEDHKKFLAGKYGLDEKDLDEGEVRLADSGRFAFHVHSPSYAVRGLTLRTFETNSKFPKWDHYPVRNDLLWAGWYIRPEITHTFRPIVVVEDPISALKVSRHYLSCYLMGTDISPDKLSEILRIGRDRSVVIALDKDATAKASELLKKWSFFLGQNTRCVQLEKDLKYATNSEIRAIIGET